jgi:hypothetical protein
MIEGSPAQTSPALLALVVNAKFLQDCAGHG